MLLKIELNNSAQSKNGTRLSVFSKYLNLRLFSVMKKSGITLYFSLM